MPGWWTVHPQLWRRELDAFAARGWACSVEEAMAERGVIGVHVGYPLPPEYAAVYRPPGQPWAGPAADHDVADPADRGAADPAVVPLLVRYPAAYPWFPPQVIDPADRLQLARHRHPVTGVLCLVAGRDWRISSTAAELLAEQLPRLLAAAAATGPLPAEEEVGAPEPAGHLLVRHAGPSMVVDSSSLIVPPEHRSGVLLAGFMRLADGTLGAGVLKALRVGADTVEPLPRRLTDQFTVPVPGRWTRLEGYRPGSTPEELWRQAEATLPPDNLEPFANVDSEPGVEVVGVLLPSETSYRALGEEWVFLLRHRTPTCDCRPPDPTAEGAPAGEGWHYELYRSAAAGIDDTLARTPATRALRDKRAVVVGIGALGGTVAMELARAGIGHLDLVDGDTVDPATACRQAAPAVYAGFPKVAVLRELIAENNPHVDAGAHVVTIGAVQVTNQEQLDPHRALAHLVHHADLVIDTAADPAVSRYLAGLCQAQRRAFLHASATAGAHGGIAALLQPGRSGCWWCLLHHRHDHTVPFPPADPSTGTVVPAGCTEPTFTGTGADLTTIAAHATRTAISHLTGAPARAGSGSVLYVASLRDQHGQPIAVRWRTRPIRRHPACPMHHPRQARPNPDAEPHAAPTAPPDTARTIPATAGQPQHGRSGTQLDNSTEDNNTTRPGITGGQGGARPESGQTRR